MTVCSVVARRMLAVLGLACALGSAACTPGPPATFVTRNPSNYIGAPGNYGI